MPSCLGVVVLKKSLDYETVSSYSLELEAVDQAEDGEDRLAARASIIIQVSRCDLQEVELSSKENLYVEFPKVRLLVPYYYYCM